MKKVIQKFLQLSSNRQLKSKRQSDSTELQQRNAEGSSSDPLDVSHSSLRSRASYRLDGGNCSNRIGIRLSTGSNNTFQQQQQQRTSLSFRSLDEDDDDDDDHTGMGPSSSSKRAIVASNTVKEDSQGTMDTSHSVDDCDEVLHASTSPCNYHGMIRLERRDEESTLDVLRCQNTGAVDILEHHLEDAAAVEPKSEENDRGSLLASRLSTNTTTLLSPATSTPLSTVTSGKQVRFGHVEIYEHLVALGGAVPSSGPSLTIQYDSQASFSISVDDYEEHRPSPRKGTQLLRSKTQRIKLLLDLGYTMREINDSCQECDMIRRQRAKSSRQVVLTSFIGLHRSYRRMKKSNSV
ncbi:hypothetical protein IV203_027704 [Nitzschia inconspicua]|uniref:Uncharacterized protein n=1 Tax=Nitzschia inconspicua TaxID=303405 RepID=A0A9K3Q3Q2_9STRA|nr:hypothetical protein IV203_027704 [Nitzschia inconspicua]